MENLFISTAENLYNFWASWGDSLYPDIGKLLDDGQVVIEQT
jgi:hypothetical protein